MMKSYITFQGAMAVRKSYNLHTNRSQLTTTAFEADHHAPHAKRTSSFANQSNARLVDSDEYFNETKFFS
ncbi:hypothetical protein CEW92_16420 [Bacillaceae bacterium SAS-127]|nr:hypothetical protein CEW92_16420 [Bacillaceae bacterium SAS-127]